MELCQNADIIGGDEKIYFTKTFLNIFYLKLSAIISDRNVIDR